jgi:hypothetical protein
LLTEVGAWYGRGMKEISNSNFGILIAYLVPGFVTLVGVGRFIPVVRESLMVSSASAPTVEGFLFVTLAAIGLGLLVNAVRWQIIDNLHYWTGVPRRSWDYSMLPDRIGAFQYLVANQFRYYECYSNLVVAVGASHGSAELAGHATWSERTIVAVILVILWNASRKTLANYHSRIGAFLTAGLQRDSVDAEIVDQVENVRYTPIRSIGPRQRVIRSKFPLGETPPQRANTWTIYRRVSVK